MPRPRSRLAREIDTVQAMIRLYCRDQRHADSHPCPACGELERYAVQRLRRCPYGEGKTTCLRCPTHCYRPAMRQRIRKVMRYAGPRMTYRHPRMAIMHLLDGLRKRPLRVAASTIMPSQPEDEQDA